MSAREARSELRQGFTEGLNRARLRALLESALGQARRGRYLKVELPAPTVPVDKLLSAQNGEGLIWDPPQGLQFAGLGNCYRWAAGNEASLGDARPSQTDDSAREDLKLATFKGYARPPLADDSGREDMKLGTFKGDDLGLRRLREEIRSISRATDAVAAPGLSASRLRIFGGLAFSSSPSPPAARPLSREWRDFGRGAFTLPRWLYTLDAEGARLAFMDSGRSVQSTGQEAILGEFDAMFSALLAKSSPKPVASSRVTSQMPRGQWNELVEGALSDIRRGKLNKVVLARIATVESERPFDASRVLSQLSVARGGNPTRFAFREPRATFVGATPEKLVVRRGREVSTEALAGSIAAAAPHASSALTSSAKDQEEHRWVVSAMVRRLSPFCERLLVPDRTQVKRFGDVSHLWTPIEGHLAREIHVLELVAALHPTPAVGGEPTDAALKWISEREPHSRGWYAGPIGWFDENGDGEFYVAIRSALLAGNRAFVYAGAGLVADSDSAAEYAETALKQRLLLRGLGALQ